MASGLNSVAPGPIWTPLIPATMPPEKVEKFGENTPLGRPGQPKELAPVYVLLASDDGSYISRSPQSPAVSRCSEPFRRWRMLLREVDAVVIGAGPNGLVAANRLVDAGWDTPPPEAQLEVGGAVRSDRELHPDFVSDTFSAFYPTAAASRVITGLHLEEYGRALGPCSRSIWAFGWRRLKGDAASRHRHHRQAAG